MSKVTIDRIEIGFDKPVEIDASAVDLAIVVLIVALFITGDAISDHSKRLTTIEQRLNITQE